MVFLDIYTVNQNMVSKLVVSMLLTSKKYKRKKISGVKLPFGTLVLKN